MNAKFHPSSLVISIATTLSLSTGLAFGADEVMQIATSDALVDASALKVRFNFDAPPDGLALTWPCGTLECTPTLSPPIPWAPVAGAVSPYVIKQTAPAGFYRVRR